MVKIFLCHASEDKPQVREIHEKLKAFGFDPWLDEKHLLPGQNWEYEIERALKASDFVLVFLSTRSVQKTGYVQREFRRVLYHAEERPEGFIHTIPVKLDNCSVPEQFSQLQWVNLYEDGAFNRIIAALRHGLQQRGQPVPEPATPTPLPQADTISSDIHRQNTFPEADMLDFLPWSGPDILADRKREREGERFQLVRNGDHIQEYTRQQIDKLTSTQRERLFASDPEMKDWWRGKSMTNGTWPLFRIRGGSWISKGKIEEAYEQASEEQRAAIWKISGLNDWYVDGLVF